MAGIIDYPQIVQEALGDFGDLFANEPQRRHFADYLTGLDVAQRKNVAAITREFAQATGQSCLNRHLTEAAWDARQLNQRRLDLLQQAADTRYHERGVIALDNTLVDHHGELIPDAGWFWDHAEERYKVAQDYLIANYVHPEGKHYPLDFRRFRKAELCAELGVPFRGHAALCQELIDRVCQQGIPGTFTFDSSFTSAPILNHIHRQPTATGQPRGYVGSLKFNRRLLYRGHLVKATDLAASIAPALRKAVREGERTQWYFTCTLHIPDVEHKVRILILWQHRTDAQARIILVTNRVQWEVSKIIRTYRHRWTGTETFHRDGKQQLGLGDCQLPDDEGQTRHMYLVLLAYSLVVKQLRQGHAYDWAFARLTTVGQACRAILRETLRTTLTWAMQHVADYGWTTERVVAYLGLTGA